VTETSAPVVIAGGGIGGLALAIALRRRDVPVVVLERARGFTETGSGVVLAANGMTALAAIDPALAAAVREAGRVSGARGQTGHLSPFTTSSGRVLSQTSFDGAEERWGAPLVAVQRARLHAVLDAFAARHGVEVRTGHPVTGWSESDEGVEVALADATTVRGSVLVGADGLRSAVRRQLLDDGPPRYRGISAVRGLGPASARWPDGFIAYGRGLILFAAAIDADRVYWVASIRTPEGVWPAKGPAAAYADLRRRLAGWDPELTGVVAGADLADLVLTDVYDRNPVRRWSRGRVVLIGDAAHPMVYTMGQGANVALEDAATLAVRLDPTAGPVTPEVLTRFVAERADRAAKIVKQSRLFGRIGHVRNPLAVRLRDTMMSRMGGGNQEDANADLMRWRPPSGPVSVG
jgi:2-polyprenyl-6-methoxyphenol hydroxylase-like FAD-dependent oxidoreductase